MSYTLAPIAVPIPTDTTGLIPGQQIAVSIPGELTTVTWVKIANESPCGLQVRNITSGTDWIAPYSVDVYPVDGLNSSLQLSPYNILGVAAAQTPVSFLIVTWYSAGERPAGTYPVSLQRLTNVGNALTTSTSAANAFEQDFLSAFVLTGLISTKDGSVANQLDTTSGIAFLVQTDSSLGRVAPLASVHLTSAISSTYFLDLNPDGSFSFATTHSVVANHLTLATVATDGSGNISTVTDNRTLNSTMLATMAGALSLPTLAGVTTAVNGQIHLAADTTSTNPALVRMGPDLNSLADWMFILIGNGDLHLWDNHNSRNVAIFNLTGGVGFPGPLTQLGGQASAGSFGAPVIVAQALRVHVTATTQQTVLSYTPPATGLYRVSVYVRQTNNASTTISSLVEWTDPDSGAVAQGLTWGTLTVNALSRLAGANMILATPVPVYALANNALAVTWQDAAGAPNDFVSAIIERLA